MVPAVVGDPNIFLLSSTSFFSGLHSRCHFDVIHVRLSNVQITILRQAFHQSILNPDFFELSLP